MEGLPLPVKWYRHTNDHSQNEELNELNTTIRKYNIIALGDSMMKFLPILGALSVAISGAKYKDLERITVTGRDFLGRKTPDVIILMAGTNDVGECLHGTEEHITLFFRNVEATFPNRLKIVVGIRIIPKNRNWTLKAENSNTKRQKGVKLDNSKMCKKIRPLCV